MPSMSGGDQCSKNYAPHMYLRGRFIGNSEQTIEIANGYGRWVYRAGRLNDETIIAERYWESNDCHKPLGRCKKVSLNKIPKRLLAMMEEDSRAQQKLDQQKIEKTFNRRS